MTNNTKTILIVEDEKPLRSVLVDKFKSLGYKTIEAVNGQEGVEIALMAHPDMILLDILMPTLDGMAMMDQIHEDEWGKDARFIFLTNMDDRYTLKRAKRNNALDLLVKANVSIQDIVTRVEELLNKA